MKTTGCDLSILNANSAPFLIIFVIWDERWVSYVRVNPPTAAVSLAKKSIASGHKDTSKPTQNRVQQAEPIVPQRSTACYSHQDSAQPNCDRCLESNSVACVKSEISKSPEAGDAVTPSTRARKKRANKPKHTPDAIAATHL